MFNYESINFTNAREVIVVSKHQVTVYSFKISVLVDLVTHRPSVCGFILKQTLVEQLLYQKSTTRATGVSVLVQPNIHCFNKKVS